MQTAHIESMTCSFDTENPFAVIATKRDNNEPVMIMQSGGETPRTFTYWRDANMHASTVNESFQDHITNAHAIDLRHYV